MLFMYVVLTFGYHLTQESTMLFMYVVLTFGYHLTQESTMLFMYVVLTRYRLSLNPGINHVVYVCGSHSV